MAFSLYAATVPTFLQVSEAITALLDKAEIFSADRGWAADEFLQTRLIDDMFPFAHQVGFVARHSWGAIEGVRAGIFGPNMTPPPTSFAGLRDMIAQAIAGLKSVSPDEVESFVGRDMRFEFGEYRLDFRSAEDFLMSFSVPNFHFHASMAYAILRKDGAPIGKRDYLGVLPLKG